MSETQTIAELQQQLDRSKLPRHVAIIMDGNGRWAKQRGKSRIQGHRAGTQAVRAVVEASVELNLGALTLYAFSTENFKRRPILEVNALMKLLMQYLKRELQELNDQNIRLTTIGHIELLPPAVYEQLQLTMAQTSKNTGLILNLALNYGGQNEILDAVKSILYDVQHQKFSIEALTPESFATYLTTAALPELDFMIRTSGEMRISNFLLWQIAYAELYVTPVLWPDFRKEHFYEALIAYQQRSRRFGGLS
jgi:undecaprenyl diphosphate synthase